MDVVFVGYQYYLGKLHKFSTKFIGCTLSGRYSNAGVLNRCNSGLAIHHWQLLFSLSCCCGVYRWFLSFQLSLLLIDKGVPSLLPLRRLTRARWFSSPHSSRGRLVDIRFSCVVMLCRPIVPIAYVLVRPGVGSVVEDTDHHERRTVKVTLGVNCALRNYEIIIWCLDVSSHWMWGF